MICKEGILLLCLLSFGCLYSCQNTAPLNAVPRRKRSLLMVNLTMSVSNSTTDSDNLYKVGVAIGVRVDTEPQLRSLARLVEATLSQVTNQAVTPLITENAICKIARHVSKKKNGCVKMNNVKEDPTFATWRLPGQPIITFQSKPRQIIVYSSSMKEDPVTINSSILLPRWKEVH